MVTIDVLQRWGSTLALFSAGSVYVAYYLKRVVKRPMFACGNKKLEGFLRSHVPSAFQAYWPPFWCFQSHAHTILAVLFRLFIRKSYRREFTTTPDGGEIILDWLDANESSNISSDRRPTVLIMPGLTGSSQESYIKHYADDMQRLGFRSVVMNQRGYGGSKLRKLKRTSQSLVQHLSHPVFSTTTMANALLCKYAKRILCCIILLNYLAEYGSKAPLVGVLSVSAAWDLLKSNKSLEENLNWLLFNRFLTSNLRSYLKRNKHMIEDKYNVDHILESRTLYQFDNRVTAKMFGYKDATDYYTHASPYNKLNKIKVPTLCLNAADDPFAPLPTLPLTSANESSHVAMVVPMYGGHLGFMLGAIPIGKTLINRVFSEFMTAMFNHEDEMSKITR
ncbi:putative phospholipase ABHD3 [Apostichopus japonicus]|uniref:Putative phospholipase ABHD3 n=1 Tax=Stichopus japonicus TaxID=307972 RepID=A0A2G8JFD9_STIJA|nr:putative phospholipase ABHD3 [Apostichopus japonicus]